MQMAKAGNRATWFAGIIVSVLAAATRCWSADSSNTPDPLLDLLIQKGILTQQEAEKVEAEANTLRTNQAPTPQIPPSKWIISKGIKNIELFGDVRLRYENRSAEDPKKGTIDLERLRYAVRLGLRGELYDQYYYGVRLETSPNARSDFVTLGTSSAASKPYIGPFGKSNGGVNIGEVYLGWHPEDWVDVTVGKMPNPLYTSSMVWNSTITPEGAAEHLKYTVGSMDFFANLGQFLYEDTNPNRALPLGAYFTAPDSDTYDGGKWSTFLLAWEAGFNARLPKQTSLKAAAVLYVYTADGENLAPGTPGFSDTYVGQGASDPGLAGYDGYPNGYFDGYSANQTGINDLEVLEIPFELNFQIAKLDARLFGDYAYNLDGTKRAQAAYNVALAESQLTYTLPNGSVPPFFTTPIRSAQTHDVKAYQIGFALGSHDALGLVNGTAGERHDWEIRTYWQHVEQYSLDPNLLDWDFFNGLENLQGIYVAAAYSFTDNLIGTVRYGHARRINHMLGTGGVSGDIPQINPVNDYDIYQVDLTFKF